MNCQGSYNLYRNLYLNIISSLSILNTEGVSAWQFIIMTFFVNLATHFNKFRTKHAYPWIDHKKRHRIQKQDTD